MSEYADRPEAFPFRLAQLESWKREQDQWRRQVDDERIEHEQKIENLVASMERLLNKMDTLILAIIGGSITLAVSAFIFAVSVLFATGKIG